MLKLILSAVLVLSSSLSAVASCNTEGCDKILQARKSVYISDKDPKPSKGVLGSDVWAFTIFKNGKTKEMYSITKPKVKEIDGDWIILIQKKKN
jgi:hypothetical protein